MHKLIDQTNDKKRKNRWDAKTTSTLNPTLLKTHLMKRVIPIEPRKLTLSWRRLLSYRNQFINLLWKSTDWFLYNGLRHERIKIYSERNKANDSPNKFESKDVKLKTEKEDPYWNIRWFYVKRYPRKMVE